MPAGCQGLAVLAWVLWSHIAVLAKPCISEQQSEPAQPQALRSHQNQQVTTGRTGTQQFWTGKAALVNSQEGTTSPSVARPLRRPPFRLNGAHYLTILVVIIQAVEGDDMAHRSRAFVGHCTHSASDPPACKGAASAAE